MIKNYVPAHWEEEVRYELRLFVDRDGGLAFPCDADGKLLDQNDAARQNYEYAMAHPEKYPYCWNKVFSWKHSWKEPASGDCECGQHVQLINEFYGACECPKCGRCYNLFGQELKPISEWASEIYEEEI